MICCRFSKHPRRDPTARQEGTMMTPCFTGKNGKKTMKSKKSDHKIDHKIHQRAVFEFSWP